MLFVLKRCHLEMLKYVWTPRFSFAWKIKNMTFLRFMVKPQTSDIRMTYGYIWVTNGWHTDDIRVHTDDIRMTYEWHTDDMWLERKLILTLTFLKLFDNSLSKYLICKRIPWDAIICVGYLPKSERGLELAFGPHFLHGFFMLMLLI